MKNLVGIAACALLVAVPAFGDATATFTDVQNDVVAGTDVILDLTVTVGGLAEFDGVDCILGWHQAGDLTFDYSQTFKDNTLIQSGPTYDTLAGFYTNDAKLGGTQFGSAIGSTILVGQATFKTDGLAPGDYLVEINPTEDSGYSAIGLLGNTEPLSGSGFVTVIPEPASLMLLGLGAAVGLRRRRA
ncbi:MAG: PEP-CTERM sorting domain-containing protein [bacterium]|nr:PEP-CTERM sorting domain-containing protein [bacterium]